MNKFTKIFLALLLIVFLGSPLMMACKKPDPVDPKDYTVTINRPEKDILNLSQGTYTFTAKVTPSSAKPVLSWSSSNVSVMTINADTGVAELKQGGITTVTLAIEDKDPDSFVLMVNDDVTDWDLIEGSYSSNLLRSIQIHNTAIKNYTIGENYQMYNYYNFTTERGGGAVNNYEYTTILESLNGIIGSLKIIKDQPGIDPIFQDLYVYYTHEFYNAYRGIDYYLSTVTYASYTRPLTSWIVPKVGRNETVNLASNGNGTNTLYDDAMWMIRELIIAYNNVKDEDTGIFKGSMYPGRRDVRGATGVDNSNMPYRDIYLWEAEYLAEFAIDGWIPTINFGGFLQGPNHDAVNTCSNGPFISSLVWLSEIYKGKNDTVEARYYESHANPRIVTEKKSDFYLAWAERTYEYVYNYLRRSDGIYADFRGGITHTLVNGYRQVPSGTRSSDNRAFDQTPYAYNTGSVLSGVADLYRATGKERYKNEAIALANAGRSYFHKADESGMSWFNCKSVYRSVLLRAYIDMDLYGIYDTSPHIADIQNVQNYGYDNYYRDGFLPYDMIYGWSHGKNDGNNGDKSDTRPDLQMTFAYAAIFGHLAVYNASI